MRKRADSYLFYGDTGVGKTVQLGEIARWLHARTGKITRLISADSGWDPVQPLIDEGIITPFNIQYHPSPFPLLAKLSEGYWPEQTTSGKVVLTAPTSAIWDRVGMLAIEGLSTISEMLIQDHIRNARKIGQDIVGEFTQGVETGTGMESVKFGKSAPSHFGHVQDYVLLDLVPKFAALPVDLVVWTGHETRGDDKDMGDMGKGKALGPATVGKATVKRTGKKFGDTFHFLKLSTPRREKGKLVLDESGKPQQELLYRAYYEDHPDEDLTQLLWPAKLSFPLERVAALHRLFPGGYVPLTLEKGGMTRYFEFKYPPTTAALPTPPTLGAGAESGLSGPEVVNVVR